MDFNTFNNKFNYIIHKYGIYFHTMLLLYLLYRVECYPNTGIYWAFLINLLVYSYFVFLNGVAFGIKQTLLNMAANELEKQEIDEINRNN